MDRYDEHTMELERENMDRQGEAMEIRLSSLGLAGAMLGEQEIERLQAEVARLRQLNERTYCAYCEYEVPLAELDAPEKVAAHIYECENHPLGIRVRELSAEVAQLKELQPCGHPIQAIRSTPYLGDQHSNYCGWCADVDRFDREHELCQTLTAELLAYREKVARLRGALDKAATYFTNMIETPLGGEQSICGFCREEWSEHKEWCVFAAIREAAAE